MAEQAQAPASALRTGLGAGVSMAMGVALGAALALVLGVGSSIFYLVGWSAARAQQASDSLWSAPALVLLLLVLTVPAYFFLGLQWGRGMALAKVVRRYGAQWAQPLADLLASRIESLPAAHRTLHRAAEVFSVDAAVDKLRPWLGDGPVLRKILALLLDRLPLAELMQEWNESRAAHGGQAQPGDAGLRSFLAARIQLVLDDMAAPQWTWLGILLALHAVVLAVGWWLLRS